MTTLETIQSLLPTSEVRLEWMSDEHTVRGSRGPVTRPWGFNERTGKPERTGLFCCRLFGPVEDLTCICRKYQGDDHRGITCEKCGVDVVESSVRNQRFAHIDLPCPLKHPWSGLAMNTLPVLPPGARPFTGQRLTGMNALYAELLKRNELFERCSGKAAPTVLLEHERDLLQQSYDAVFGAFPKRPGRGEKLGSRLRRCLADQVPTHELPDDLALLLHAAGLEPIGVEPA